MKDRFTGFARDALAQMRCVALGALLRETPPTADPEELRLRSGCWAAIAQHLPTASGSQFGRDG